MEFEFSRFPGYYSAYLRTFAIMIRERPDMAEKYGFTSPLDVMHWWMWKSHFPQKETTKQVFLEMVEKAQNDEETDLKNLKELEGD